ncbi:MAG: hypothetical protein P4L56_03855 [Candidatus Sulfopaludibacter sp.]|nr:hypothetical protein [Candidatus Sulfopaludibacter sp.]
MPVIDLTRYIVASAGTWTNPSQDQNLFDFTLADTWSPERLMLRWAGDFVALTGPLRVRITVQAENLTLPLAFVSNLVPAATAMYQPAGASPGSSASFVNATINTGSALYESALSRIGKGALSLQASTIYTYVLDIPAGQAWPFSLSEQLDALRLQGARLSRFEQLGNNLGYRVIVEPAFAVSNCVPGNTTSDLPCDFAVANQPNTAAFFPSACEPCESSVIGLPFSSSPGTVGLITAPAAGGCVRTRFFNGMFITREDLETEQRYLRLKSKLHNRASGAGVVWGLNVAKQGSYVCVMPGYAVDCCGNDLALTSVYQVDIASLLADPAAASLLRGRNAQRLNLLLEFVECPADPRPVHGDPCSPDASRCEMSRIRESVRLRLVPPCDYNAARESAPIQSFLDEVRQLRAQYPLGNGFTATGANAAPFQLRVTLNGDSATQVTVRPSPSTTSIPLPQVPGAVTSILVEVLPDQLWSFVAGALSGQANPLEAGMTVQDITINPAGPVDLSLSNGFQGNLQVMFSSTSEGPLPPASLVFKIAAWQMQTVLANEDDPAAMGDLTFTVPVRSGKLSNNTLNQTNINYKPIGLAADPCAGEPCGPTFSFTPGGGNTYPSPCGGYAGAAQSAFTVNSDPTPVLPWLHADPTNEARAGDPKALALGALGAWLAEMLVREQFGTASAVTSTRREVAQVIYRLAWLLLFGVPQKADPAVLACSIQRLLEGWCDELLWTGPRCCCDPHGAVIGCATVEGGDIRKIDPFGGRRYVMHYPLLSHWGAQFGIAPLDITLQRFFSKLCCVSSLSAAYVNQPLVFPFVTQIGGGYLAVGDPGDIATKLSDKVVVNQRRVSTPEMIGAALAMSGTTASTGTGLQYNQLILADLVADQTVILLVPVTGQTGSAASSGQPAGNQGGGQTPGTPGQAPGQATDAAGHGTAPAGPSHPVT